MSLMMIRRTMTASFLGAAAFGLVSCASGPSYEEALKTMPPIPKGKGRVFVYRDTALGAAVRPKIRIDGQPIGTSVAQGFSYSDQAPGQHEVSLITEWKHKDMVSVSAGQPSFVRTHVTFGALVGHVIPTAVSKAEAENEIQNCKLVSEE
jgi:hypothetical protein